LIDRWLKTDIDHVIESDELMSIFCEVKFNYFILKNITECDSFIFCSHNIHTHSSASLNQLSLELWKNLLKTIVKLWDSSLTTCKWLLFKDQFFNNKSLI